MGGILGLYDVSAAALPDEVVRNAVINEVIDQIVSVFIDAVIVYFNHLRALNRRRQLPHHRRKLRALKRCACDFVLSTHIILPNAQGEPRAPLARSPAIAGGVTAVLVGSSAWLGALSGA